jgi:hypothetical protein
MGCIQPMVKPTGFENMITINSESQSNAARSPTVPNTPEITGVHL